MAINVHSYVSIFLCCCQYVLGQKIIGLAVSLSRLSPDLRKVIPWKKVVGTVKPTKVHDRIIAKYLLTVNSVCHIILI